MCYWKFQSILWTSPDTSSTYGSNFSRFLPALTNIYKTYYSESQRIPRKVMPQYITKVLSLVSILFSVS